MMRVLGLLVLFVACVGFVLPAQAVEVVGWDISKGAPVNSASSDEFPFLTWDAMGRNPVVDTVNTASQGAVEAAYFSANPTAGEPDGAEDGFRRQGTLLAGPAPGPDEVGALMNAPGLAIKTRAWVDPNVDAHERKAPNAVPADEQYFFDGRIRKSFAGDTMTGAAIELGTNATWPATGNASGNPRGYRLMLTASDDGDPVVMMSVPEASYPDQPMYEVEGGAGDFHDYELRVFQSNRDLQHLYVDGTRVLSFETPTSSPDGNTARAGDCCGGAPSVSWAATSVTWEAIPEPSTFVLAGFGLLSLLGFRRRGR